MAGLSGRAVGVGDCPGPGEEDVGVHLAGAVPCCALLEALVEAAQRAGHKEADFFHSAFAEVQKHDGVEGFNALVTQLFDSAEDKRVASPHQLAQDYAH